MVPLERRELEDRLATGASQLDATKQKAREIEVEKKKLEVEAQAKRDHIAKYKTQQFQTRKNEEFQALGNEIKRFEADVQKIEDRELDLMEAADQMKGTLSAADKTHAQSKTQIEKQLVDLDEKVKAIEVHLREIEAERKTLAQNVDEDLLDHYERLFANKNGLAVAPLEHEVCMGCHMKITAQTAVRVKGEKEIVSCEQCGRILYPAE